MGKQGDQQQAAFAELEPARGWSSTGPRQRVRQRWTARPAYRAAASRCIKIAGIGEVYTKASDSLSPPFPAQPC
jgi:hypothetical protein